MTVAFSSFQEDGSDEEVEESNYDYENEALVARIEPLSEYAAAPINETKKQTKLIEKEHISQKERQDECAAPDTQGCSMGILN